MLPALWLLATISTATADQFGDFTYEINSPPDTNTVTITVNGAVLRGYAVEYRP